MKKYKLIFVVLAFRTGQDIPGFIKSISSKIDDYRIIIVNSFYSEESLEEIHDIAVNHGCDFVPVDNKGYGYGNNKGIEYAQEHYDYDYLIVCNADIEIQKMDLAVLSPDKLNAPMITTITGKMQNPYWAHRNKLGEWLIYQGHRRRSRMSMILGQGINKLIREGFLFRFLHSNRQTANIYAAHGSFLIFPKQLIEQLQPVFDEKMFLYYEEAFLSNRLHRNNIGIVLHKGISILHYEDGSTKGSNLDLSHYASNSFLYYYENCCNK